MCKKNLRLTCNSISINMGHILNQRKGVDLLLNALAKVKSEYSLYLAGEGEEKEQLQKHAENL